MRGELKTHPVPQTADLLHQGGTLTTLPESLSRACVRARERVWAVAVVARCTVAWQSAVNTQLKRRGLTSRAAKTSLIQYFRWRNRAREQVAYRRRRAPHRVAARSLLARRKVGIHSKWKNAVPPGISARGLGHDRSDRQRVKFLGGMRRRLSRRFFSFSHRLPRP